MAANVTPIFPESPLLAVATLTSATALTTRTNIVGTTGLTKLTDASTDGLRIDAIRVKSKATSVASSLCVWLYDGTTSYLIDEIAITVVAASTTVASFTTTIPYTTLNLSPTQQLYVSETVQTDLTVFAHGGSY